MRILAATLATAVGCMLVQLPATTSALCCVGAAVLAWAYEEGRR